MHIHIFTNVLEYFILINQAKQKSTPATKKVAFHITKAVIVSLSLADMGYMSLDDFI